MANNGTEVSEPQPICLPKTPNHHGYTDRNTRINPEFLIEQEAVQGNQFPEERQLHAPANSHNVPVNSVTKCNQI